MTLGTPMENQKYTWKLSEKPNYYSGYKFELYEGDVSFFHYALIQSLSARLVTLSTASHGPPSRRRCILPFFRRALLSLSVAAKSGEEAIMTVAIRSCLLNQPKNAKRTAEFTCGLQHDPSNLRNPKSQTPNLYSAGVCGLAACARVPPQAEEGGTQGSRLAHQQASPRGRQDQLQDVP